MKTGGFSDAEILAAVAELAAAQSVVYPYQVRLHLLGYPGWRSYAWWNRGKIITPQRIVRVMKKNGWVHAPGRNAHHTGYVRSRNDRR